MNIFWFIVWLIGAIISTYVVFKYAEPIKMVKHIWKAFKQQNKIKDKLLVFGTLLFVIFCAVPGYIVLSWFGAFATYVIFNDFDNR